MRLAFVDLYFSWPPHGGADVDLRHVLIELQRLGHDVRLFVASDDASWERGTVDPAALPFPATRIDLQTHEVNRREMPGRFRVAVDAWKPDAVFVCDGFFLKPYVSAALAHYPMVSRYYAYELSCPRDSRLFKNGAPCPMNYLRTPDFCRRCSLEGELGADIKRWRFLCWSQEYLAARAFMPGYHARLLQSLSQYRVIIVSNPIHLRQLAGLHDNVRIVPGGVDIGDFTFVPPADKRREDRKVILMTGRVEDPIKGLETLREAGERLARARHDFEMRATHTDVRLDTDWFKSVGWHDPAGMIRLYQESDICVVPSIWEEPFGLVAVEAMAVGRPVCASRVGGLQSIVVDGETGFLFDGGDSAALAERLAQLLDSPELRQRMGLAARKRAEAEFDWAQIARKFYLPILEELVR